MLVEHVGDLKPFFGDKLVDPVLVPDRIDDRPERGVARSGPTVGDEGAFRSGHAWFVKAEPVIKLAGLEFALDLRKVRQVAPLVKGLAHRPKRELPGVLGLRLHVHPVGHVECEHRVVLGTVVLVPVVRVLGQLVSEFVEHAPGWVRQADPRARARRALAGPGLEEDLANEVARGGHVPALRRRPVVVGEPPPVDGLRVPPPPVVHDADHAALEVARPLHPERRRLAFRQLVLADGVADHAVVLVEEVHALAHAQVRRVKVVDDSPIAKGARNPARIPALRLRRGAEHRQLLPVLVQRTALVVESKLDHGEHRRLAPSVLGRRREVQVPIFQLLRTQKRILEPRVFDQMLEPPRREALVDGIEVVGVPVRRRHVVLVGLEGVPAAVLFQVGDGVGRAPHAVAPLRVRIAWRRRAGARADARLLGEARVGARVAVARVAARAVVAALGRLARGARGALCLVLGLRGLGVGAGDGARLAARANGRGGPLACGHRVLGGGCSVVGARWLVLPLGARAALAAAGAPPAPAWAPRPDRGASQKGKLYIYMLHIWGV